MSTAENFLREIEAFLDRTGMPPTSFGLAAVNDGHLVRDLRAGKDVRASTIDRVREFMSEHENPQRRRRPNRQASACAA